MILNPFKGKNVLITGGSKGIGLCMAKELAALEANVAIIARDKKALETAKREIEEAGSGTRCLAYACDVTDAATLSDYINMIRYEFGTIDGIIANSGYCHPGNFHEIDLADIDRQIDVNLKGVAYTLRLGIPHLLDNGGGFVAITSSPAGNAGIFGFSIYGATKSALNIMSHILRAEYSRKNIRVHLLLPPDTDTPGYAEEISLYPKETKAILDGGVLLQPEPVAKKFIRGIANNKKTISAGASSRLVLIIMRIAPFIWDLYVKSKIRAANRPEIESSKQPEATPESTIDEDSPASETETPEGPEEPENESAPVDSPDTTDEKDPEASNNEPDDELDDESDDFIPEETETPEYESTPEEDDPKPSDSDTDPKSDSDPKETETSSVDEPDQDEPHDLGTAQGSEDDQSDVSDVSDLGQITITLEIEVLKPFLDRITKYAAGLEHEVTDILMGVAEMDGTNDKSWEIDAQHEQQKVPLRINVSVNTDDSIDIRFDTTTKLSLIIDQEFYRM